MFRQEGYHDWCKINSVQQLAVGSYVKLRKHPTNVADKVWSCHDFRTQEPCRPASNNVKGKFQQLGLILDVSSSGICGGLCNLSFLECGI